MSAGNFGRATFELRTTRAAFRSELSQAEIDARQAATIIDRNLQNAAEGLGESAKKEAQEFDRNLDQAAKRAREHAADIRSALGNVSGTAGSILSAGGPVATGVAAIVAGLLAIVGAARLAGEAIGSLTAVSFDYNRTVQNATNLLVAYTGSQERANSALRLAKEEADAGRGVFGELANAIALLQPSARTSGESIEALTELMEILAATNPAEGIAGAAIALREAASGDFTSVAERFNISRIAIQRLRDEGVGNVEAVRRALADMGITFAVVEQQSRSVDVLQRRLEGLGQRFVGEAGAPVFVAFNNGLGELVDLLSDPRIERGSAKIADLFSTIGEGFDRGFAQDELVRAIDDLLDAVNSADFEGFAQGVQDTAEGAGILVTAVVRATTTIGDLLGVLGKVPGIAGFAKQAISELLPPVEVILGLVDLTQKLGQVNREIDELAQKQGVLGAIGRALGGGRPETREATPVDLSPPGVVQPDFDPGVGVNDVFQSQQRIAREAGLRSAQAYVGGFTEETARQFGAAHGVLRDSLLAAVGGDETRITATQNARAFELVARAMSEIQATGFATADTISEIRREFGDTADATIAYIEQVERLNKAQADYDRTVSAVKTAQDNLTAAIEETSAASKRAQANIDAAERTRASNAQATRDAVAAQQQLLDDLADEAKDVADRYAEIAQGLQDQAAAAREAAAAAQAARQAQIASAQEELNNTQSLAREHAAAFAAIQSGTVDQFLALNGEVDESTRKIIESYGAQAQAAIAARNAAEGRADEIGVEGRRRLLDLETQIRAARSQGDFAQAAALERQRDLERQRFQSREAFARQQAAVAQDEVNAALKPVEAAAQAQAVADAAAGRAAAARLAQLQAEDAERRKSEAAAIKAIEDEIAANERAARDEAKRFADRQEAIEDHIDDIEEAGRVQAREDAQEIARLGVIKAAVDALGLVRVNAATDARDLAIEQRDAALDTLNYQKEQLSTLEAQIKALQDFLDANPGVTPWGFRPGYTPPPLPGAGGGGGSLEAFRTLPNDVTPFTPGTADFNPSAPAFSFAPVGAFAPVAAFGGPEFIRVPSPAFPGGGATRPLDLSGVPLTGTGDVRMEFHAPLVTFPDLRVDSEERAQFVIGESIRGVRRALAGFVNAGPPTFRG